MAGIIKVPFVAVAATASLKDATQSVVLSAFAPNHSTLLFLIPLRVPVPLNVKYAPGGILNVTLAGIASGVLIAHAPGRSKRVTLFVVPFAVRAAWMVAWVYAVPPP